MRLGKLFMNRILFVVFMLFPLTSFSYDMFDIAVCEAQPNDNSRVVCFRELHQIVGLCNEAILAEELKCFRRISKSKMPALEKSLGQYYVSSETLDVRLAPNDGARVTNTLYEKQKVDVLEIKDGWGRISRYYDGTIEGEEGVVARWVLMSRLTGRPISIQQSSNQEPSRLELAIRSSDNFTTYRNAFINASRKLLDEGKCDLGDFQEMGGWVRSSNYKPKPVFFTYCGGMSKENRIYLNAKTGQLF